TAFDPRSAWLRQVSQDANKIIHIVELEEIGSGRRHFTKDRDVATYDGQSALSRLHYRKAKTFDFRRNDQCVAVAIEPIDIAIGSIANQVDASSEFWVLRDILQQIFGLPTTGTDNREAHLGSLRP